MVRHIFIAPVKDGVSAELLEKKMEEMRGLKEQVPEIDALSVAQATGWVGVANAVVMVADLRDKDAFDALIQSPAHTEISSKAAEAFDTARFVAVQVEY